MGRGGYNGGSTMLRQGRKWLFDPEFDAVTKDSKGGGDDFLYFSYLRKWKPTPNPPELKAGGREISTRTLNKHRMAIAQHLDRDAVLAGLDCPLPNNPTERRLELKRLVAKKILLSTGAINVGHPKVAAWIKKNGKSAKSNV